MLNCDVIKKNITEHIFPKVYLTYLSEISHDNSPTLEKFLSDFRLNENNLSESTTWRWMTCLGFQYDERKNHISLIDMKLKRIVNFVKKLIRIREDIP